MDSPENEPANLSLDKDTVFFIGVVIEGALLLAATAWIFIDRVNLAPAFHLNRKILMLGLNAGLLVTLVNVLLWLASIKFRHSSTFFRSWFDLIHKETMPLLGNLNLFQRIFLSLCAGVSEEVFFRGVMEAEAGPFFTNLAFGFAHLPKLYYLSYALWAMSVGYVMSYLKAQTGGLLAPIIAHTLIDIISLCILAGIKNKIEKQPKQQ